MITLDVEKGQELTQIGLIMIDSKQLLTPEQVSEILQVHILTVYDYIRSGRLNAVRLGRNYRVLPTDLNLFLEANRVKVFIKLENWVKPSSMVMEGKHGY
jgi:excisionase family DNA binding protein